MRTLIKKTGVGAVLTAAVLAFAVSAASSVQAGSAEPDAPSRKAAAYGNVKVSGTSDDVRAAIGSSHGSRVSLSKWNLDGSLSYFHGMFYEATVRKTVKASAKDSKGGTVTVRKGEKIIVMCLPSRSGKAVCRLKSGRTVSIPAKKIKVDRFLYNSSSAYSDAQVEEWVASRGITSKTDMMLVISKFNQRAWILKRSAKAWKCEYVLKVTTSSRRNGSGKLPNDCYGLNKCSIQTHYKNKKGMGRGISYASKTGGNQIHYRGNSLYPSTHGCVGMGRKDYEFVYWRMPYGTKVVLF